MTDGEALAFRFQDLDTGGERPEVRAALGGVGRAADRDPHAVHVRHLSPEARQVPGLLFIGGKDLASCQDAIRGLSAINRRAGALWALVEEPTAAHVVGQSREMAEVFFEDLLTIRLGSPSAPKQAELRSLAEKDGFTGDPKTHNAQKIGTGGERWLC